MVTAGKEEGKRTGVEHVVLDVPAEGGEHHAHVEPGQRHPGDVVVQVLQQAAAQLGQVVQVPGVLRVLALRFVVQKAATAALQNSKRPLASLQLWNSGGQPAESPEVAAQKHFQTTPQQILLSAP